MVKILIRGGADVNAAGGKYGYALCAAASCGFTEVLWVLLDPGAVTDTHEGPHGRPYHHALLDAIGNGHTDIAEILFEEGAKRQLETTNANCNSRLKVT